MTTLIAQVTILRKGPDAPLHYVNGSMAYDAWRNPILVAPGQAFVEIDAAEVTRLVGMGAARVQ